MKTHLLRTLSKGILILAGLSSAAFAQSDQPFYPPADGVYGGQGPGGYGPGGYGPGGSGSYDGRTYAASAPGGEGAPFGSRVIVEGNVGESYGWDDNYFNVHTFLPWHLDPGQNLFFANLGGSVTDNGQFIGNFGGGYRQIIPGGQRLVGISGWLDWDDSHNQAYQRAGISLETLGNIFDARLNAYAILGDDREVLSRNTFSLFRANSLLINRQVVAEDAYGGVDAEIGGLMPHLGQFGVYGYLGGYHLISSDVDDVTGVSLRTNVAVTENVSVGGTYTYDDTFDHNFFMNVALTFPAGMPQYWFKPTPLPYRLGEPVHRRDRIPVNRAVQDNVDLAINPKDGQPFSVLHVNPNSRFTGTGSFETPFTDINQANLANNSAVDLIFVSPVAAAPNAGLALNQTFQLFDCQRLIAATQPQTFTATQGSFILPGFFNGPRPILSQTFAGNVVTLANENEVSGFFFQGNGTGSAIFGSNVTDFNVNNNVDPNSFYGVDLINAAGNGLIASNTFQNNLFGGVRISNNVGTAPLNLAVVSNRFEDNAGVGLQVTLRDDAQATVDIRNNVIVSTGNDNNPSTPGVGDGIQLRLEGSAAVPQHATARFNSILIDGNVIGDSVNDSLGNAGSGIVLFAAEETVLQDVFITNNLIARNLIDGIRVERLDDAVTLMSGLTTQTQPITIADNTITDNFGNGIRIQAGGGSRNNTVLGFDVRRNSILRNARNNGPAFNTADTLRTLGNPFGFEAFLGTSQLAGISLFVEADARLIVDITQNNVDANVGSGIFTSENFGAEADMREIGGTWIANRITNSALWGIRLDATSTNIFNEIDPNLTANLLGIFGNLIDNNGFDGIEINGPGRIRIDSNQISNNGVNAAPSTATIFGNGDDQGNGIDVQSLLLDQNGLVTIQTALAQDVLSPNSLLEPRAASPKFVEIFRNVIRGNAHDGLEIRHANNPSTLHDAPLHPGFFPLTVIARNNTIEFNGGRGVDILNQGGLRTPEPLDSNPPETGADPSVDPPVATLPNTSNQFSPTDTTVRLLDNKIASNAKEGVYVVNTASLTQGQAGNTPVPISPEDQFRGLRSDGNFDAVPRLALEVDHNLIIKNGNQLDVDPATGAPIDTITASGLVIRVGTSDVNVSFEVNQLDTTGLPISFFDFASSPAGDPGGQNLDQRLFEETGFRNADEILSNPSLFGQLGFFSRLQPGGVIAKISNNGLRADGSIDPTSGFEGNFGSDFYVESFVSSGVGTILPSVARFDVIFENNRGDSIDATNFGAFFGVPRQNGQRLPGNLNIPGLPLFGRIVGIHSSQVQDSGLTGDEATVNGIFALDSADTVPGGSPLDDRATVYNGLEIVFGSTNQAGLARNVQNHGGLVSVALAAPGVAITGLRNSIGVTPALPAVPANGDAFRVELSQPTIFDIVLLSGDPTRDPTVTPITTNLATNTLLNQGAIIRFIDEQDPLNPNNPALVNAQQPVRTQQVIVLNNYQLTNGQVAAGEPLTGFGANPNRFHIQNGVQADNVSNVPGTGRGPVATQSSLTGVTPGTTSNQTLQVAPGLTQAPRDGNLFVITSVQAGAGDSAFRVSGAQTAAQAENVGPALGRDLERGETNMFNTKNLGFNDAVSLESPTPLGNERPFEWGSLPTANDARIRAIFAPLGDLPLPPVLNFNSALVFP